MEANEISDEILNAYLDNELANSEREMVIKAIKTNDSIGQRLFQLDQVRNMVRMAYQEPEVETSSPNKNNNTVSRITTIAASIILSVGFVFGWVLHSSQTPQSLTSIANDYFENTSVQQDQTWNILVHVTSDDPYRLKVVLDETESILQTYENKQQSVSIRILANGPGLNLLRDDKSPYAQQISSLQSKYDNIVFAACAKAIDRLEIEKGIQVQLLPNTQIAPSAVNEVLNRQKEGWTYIKI